MHLIGIDPGETTGVCVYSALPMEQHDIELEVPMQDGPPKPEWYWYHQFPTNSPSQYYMFKNWLSYMTSGFFGAMADVDVILERFEWRMDPEAKERTKISYVPAEVCGIVKEASYRYRFNLIVQSASQATGHAKGNEGAFWNDRKLHKIGAYMVNKRHAMDALRHVLYYRLFTLGDESLLRLLK